MPSNSASRILTVLAVVCVCLSATTAAAATTPQSTTANACTPRIDTIERSEAVGDVLDVEFLLCFEGSVTVSGPGYNGTARLDSGSQSGFVTLHINTHKRGDSVFTVTSDRLDGVELTANGTGSFEPGTYTITVRDGSGDVTDTATVELTAPRARNLTIWRAPRGTAASLQTVAAVQASRTAVSAVDSQHHPDDGTSNALTVAANETLIVRVRATGLAGAFKAASGTPLARFRTALRKTGGGSQANKPRKR